MLLLMLLLAPAAEASVVGVTYRDDVGVEDRYKNELHCDPFFWYPLHLPEDCQEHYQKQIINMLLGKNQPTLPPPSDESEEIAPRVSFFGDRPKNGLDRKKRESYFDSGAADLWGADTPFNKDRVLFPISGGSSEEGEDENVPLYKGPYGDVLEALNADIALNPIQPQVRMTNMGPVAVYQQPVGKVTARRIESLSQFNRNGRKKKHGVETTIRKVLKKMENYKGNSNSENPSKGKHYIFATE